MALQCIVSLDTRNPYTPKCYDSFALVDMEMHAMDVVDEMNDMDPAPPCLYTRQLLLELLGQLEICQGNFAVSEPVDSAYAQSLAQDKPDNVRWARAAVWHAYEIYTYLLQVVKSRVFQPLRHYKLCPSLIFPQHLPCHLRAFFLHNLDIHSFRQIPWQLRGIVVTQHQTLQVLDSRQFSGKLYIPSGAIVIASLLGVPEDVEMSKVRGVAHEDTEHLVPGSSPVADVSLHKDTEGSVKHDVASTGNIKPVAVPLGSERRKTFFEYSTVRPSAAIRLHVRRMDGARVVGREEKPGKVRVCGAGARQRGMI
ncbi:MAG: hypothetical protein L6R35_003536 [Caloplaca aegaea]|nr:MAG: hypothetical protein L6R35_003536 [Caloplaca aegaea]